MLLQLEGFSIMVDMPVGRLRNSHEIMILGAVCRNTH